MFFLVIHFLTWVIGVTVFSIFTDIKIFQMQAAINNYQVDGKSFFESLQFVQALVHYFTRHHIPPETVMQFYKENKMAMKGELMMALEADKQTNIGNLTEYFVFGLRALIAISFIKFHIATLHYWMFITLVVIIVVCLLGIYFSYHVASLLPSLARKFCETADRYAYFHTSIDHQAPVLLPELGAKDMSVSKE